METLGLIESFQEFKEFKNIDREKMMRILEDVFRSMIIKKYGSDDNFDIIINIDKGDLEVWRNRIIVEDGEVEDDGDANPREGRTSATEVNYHRKIILVLYLSRIQNRVADFVQVLVNFFIRS